MFFRALQQAGNSIIKGNRANRRALRVRRGGGEGFQMIGGGQMDEVDFGEIMVLSGQPKYRDGSGSIRQENGRQGLQHHKHGATEERHLLSGDNYGSTLFETLDVLERFGSGTQAAVLTFEHCRHLLPAILGALNALLFVLPPVGNGRGTSIEVADLVEMIEKIKKERGGVGNARKWERSEEHTSELQSRPHLVCRLLLEKKKKKNK